MGILDDAIREHLELKRQLGADDSELKRLEDEAFGPPSRPGEADFGPAEAETTVAEAPPPAQAPPVAPEPSVAEAPVEIEEPPAPEEPPPVEEPPAPEDSVAEEAADRGEGAEGEQATALYDHTADADADADVGGGIELEELDLELDDEELIPEAPEGAVEPRPDEAPAAEPPSEPPIESLETVEHPFPDELIEGEEERPEEAGPAPDPADGPAGEDEKSDQDDEDVLADTPEFLKDAPEDDELWFEQGKPKDFDF
jgi:hypothetical protein